jgi:hypothetical protein
MQQALTTSLAGFTCPADETCTLVVEDLPDMPGIAVLLKRQKSVRADKPWIVDHDPATGTYLYNAVFETESPAEIATAIKSLLDMPGS